MPAHVNTKGPVQVTGSGPIELARDRWNFISELSPNFMESGHARNGIPVLVFHTSDGKLPSNDATPSALTTAVGWTQICPSHQDRLESMARACC